MRECFDCHRWLLARWAPFREIFSKWGKVTLNIWYWILGTYTAVLDNLSTGYLYWPVWAQLSCWRSNETPPGNVMDGGLSWWQRWWWWWYCHRHHHCQTKMRMIHLIELFKVQQNSSVVQNFHLHGSPHLSENLRDFTFKRKSFNGGFPFDFGQFDNGTL